jgi:hypothetical protein
MTILEQLAAFANSTLPEGINWQEQLQQYGSREGSVRAYRDDPDGKGGYWSDMMTIRASCVVPFSTLGLDVRVDPEIWRASSDKNAIDIDARSKELEVYLQTKQQKLSRPVELNGEALRDFLQNYLALLNDAVSMHTTRLIFRLGGTETQIADDADRITRAYRQLKYLYDSGLLDYLRPSAKGEVSVTYLAGVLIGVGVLILVAIIAAALLYSRYLTLSIEAARAACMKMIETGATGAEGMCKGLIPKPPIEPFDPNRAVSSGIMMVGVLAALGIGAWALVSARRSK